VCVGPPQCARFFFSSRRRHTRFSRDWSSDVCSSDLLQTVGILSTAYSTKYPPAHPSTPPLSETIQRTSIFQHLERIPHRRHTMRPIRNLFLHSLVISSGGRSLR